MRLSKLFSKTRKEAPADETAKNAVALIRAGFIHKEMAGVYSYLPLGLKVLNNIAEVVRQEMNAIGGRLWLKSNRFTHKHLFQNGTFKKFLRSVFCYNFSFI